MPDRERRLFPWRALSRILFFLAGMCAVIALAYRVEDWRCQRAWEQFRAAAEARGEHLERSYFIPKPVPDDQNFFMAGDLPKTLFPPFHIADKDRYPYFKWGDHYAWAFQHIGTPRTGFYLIDLATWEKALAAAKSNRSDLF